MVRLFKQITTIALLSTSLTVLVTGCASSKMSSTSDESKAKTAMTAKSTINAPISKSGPEVVAGTNANGAPLVIERVPFELGISSVTVERIAKQNNCQSKKGAGLLYKKSPIEVYRVECEDGREIKARCEMRQCEIFKP